MPHTLRVCSNPFCAFDADGDPCGYVDRTDVPGGRLIGGTVDAERSVFASGKSADAVSSSAHAPKYKQRAEAEDIADTAAHRALLRTGQILPGDEATATLAGVRWLPVAVALEVERGKAAAKWLAARGAPLPATLTPITTTKPTKSTAAPAAPAA